jgi:hypothetical protein
MSQGEGDVPSLMMTWTGFADALPGAAANDAIVEAVL